MPPVEREDAQARARRVSAGTLLLAEKDTRDDVSEALDESVDLAVADAVRETRRDRARKAALLALLLLGSRRMAGKLKDAILGGRQRARVKAAARARAELISVGITAAMADLVLGGHHARFGEDDTHATSAAEALAAAWQSMSVHIILRALRREDDVAAELSKTRQAIESRGIRTAVTETARAYNDEHEAAVTETAAGDATFAAALEAAQVVRVWDAILDMRTCAVCRDMHGEIAPVGGSFRGGWEPGLTHPLCRCIDIVCTHAMALKIAA